jgi:hypothetical protein
MTGPLMKPILNRSAKLVLLTAGGAVALALMTAVGMLWFRSYGGRDMLRYHTAGGNRVGWISSGGSVAFEAHSNEVYYDPTRPQGFRWNADGYVQDFRVSNWTTPTQWRLGSFRLVINRGNKSAGQASARPGSWENRVVVAPLWACFAIACVPLVMCARALRRLGSRHPPGSCQACGYDLRATRDQCPECGAKMEGTAAPLEPALTKPER